MGNIALKDTRNLKKKIVVKCLQGGHTSQEDNIIL